MPPSNSEQPNDVGYECATAEADEAEVVAIPVVDISKKKKRKTKAMIQEEIRVDGQVGIFSGDATVLAQYPHIAEVSVRLAKTVCFKVYMNFWKRYAAE